MLLKHLAKTLVIFLVWLSVSCKSGAKTETCPMDESVFQNKDFIVTSFGKVNMKILDQTDSCIFTSYISNRGFSQNELLVKSWNGVHLTNVTCPYVDFTFSTVLDSVGTPFFYGNFDIYYLKYFPNAEDSFKVIDFDDRGLNLVIAKCANITPKGSDKQIEDRLSFFLYQLYFQNLNNINSPIFDGGILKKNTVYEYVNDSTVVSKIMDDHTVSFVGKHFGIVSFKWYRVEDRVFVKEFLVPFRRLKFFRSDVIPDFATPCFEVKR